MAILGNNSHHEAGVNTPCGEMSKKKKAHVLVLPFPAQGHINPMMHLSKQLAANGVIITFVNTEFNQARIMQSRASKSGVPDLESIQNEGDIRLVGVPDGLGHDEYVANFNVPKQAQALIDIQPLLVKLVEELQPPVTCIIADVFVISTPAVAKQFGIPHVTFWTQSAASYAAHLFFTQNHASLKEYVEELQKEEKEVMRCIPGCPALRYKEVPTFLQPCDPADFLFAYFITNFKTAADNAFVLMNTFEDLEAHSFASIRAPNMLSIGPILPSQFFINAHPPSLTPTRSHHMALGTSFWVEDQETCLPWLHHQLPSSVLYVSFGSITLMSPRQVSEFVAGLESSGHPFLMVVRPEMMTGAAPVAFPAGFVDRMRASGRAVFVPWAPQLEVLAHPAIGGFLTHAGWNSTLESLCRGVPMLCWPYFADQMLNARCIVDTWRVGLDFVMDEVVDKETSTSSGGDDCQNSDSNSDKVALVKREEIDKKVKQLMDPSTSQEIRNQVHMLSIAAKKAYENPSRSSFKSLLDFLFV